jgi:hypothetical protein
MIKKPNELNFDDVRFNVLIGGYPGIGKTTLGLSAPKPLLLDLDKGISRVNAKFRKDASEVETYEELLDDLNNSDLSDYETIVVDTGGRLLDLMKSWAIRKEPKNGQTDGNLTLKGYGVVGKEFMDFVNNIKYKFHKHCVVIFHAKEEKDGDLTKLRILVEGQSKDNVWQPMDLGGFIEVIGNEHKIGFTNCERYFAKGVHGIKGLWTIPNPEESGKNDFLTLLFEKMTNYLKTENSNAEKFKSDYEKIMKEIKPLIENMTFENVLEVQEKITSTKHIATSERELKNLFKNKLDEIGVTFDKETKKYVKVEK